MHGERGVPQDLHQSCDGYFGVVVFTAGGAPRLLLCGVEWCGVVGLGVRGRWCSGSERKVV